jgi:hypothetical protein
MAKKHNTIKDIIQVLAEDAEKLEFVERIVLDEEAYQYVISVLQSFEEAAEEDLSEEEDECPFKRRASHTAVWWGE